MDRDKGIIYILTNPSFPSYQKIGKTKNLKQRLNSLNNKTCLPFNFRIYATYEVEDNLSMVEESIFNIIDNVDYSVRAREETSSGRLKKREFFAIEPDKAFEILKSVARLRGDVDKLVVHKKSAEEEEEEAIADQVEERVARRKGNRFNFTQKGLALGEELSFVEDERIKVKIVGDHPPTVLFEGKKWKLSPLVGELKKRNETSNACGAYQGAAYFYYNGVKLLELLDVDEEADLEDIYLEEEIQVDLVETIDAMEQTEVGIAANNERRKGNRFSFSRKGLQVGNEICFVEDKNVVVRIVSDNPPTVLFERKEWKLSPLVAELKRRNGTSNNSGAYQGAAYFLFRGEKLTNLPDIELE